MAKRTILAIGNEVDWESFRKFRRAKEVFVKRKHGFKVVEYSAVIRCDLPNIKSEEIMVVLFFPLKYWNNRIEKRMEKGRAYGDQASLDQFIRYMDRVKDVVERTYSDKKLTYMNSFEAVRVDRDKELTKEILTKNGILVPKGYSERGVSKIIKLSKSKNLYIKVRYGAMGKGITRLTKNEWSTNFLFKWGKLRNRKGDYNWEFNDVTDNREFLKQLLSKDVVVEDAVDSCIIEGKKFDIRYYVSYGKIRHCLVRSTEVENVITNMTQGGVREPESFLDCLPRSWLKNAERNAVKTAKALNLNLAGVDVMISRRGIPYVIEAQSFPGLPKRRYHFSEQLAKDILFHWGC